MNTDKVLALAAEAGWNQREIGQTSIEERLSKFAALIQREMEAEGWRSPALKKDEALDALIKVKNEQNS